MSDSRKEMRELIFEGLELFNAATSPDDYWSASAVRAFELFRAAAERGSCVADFMLGVCFDFGRGVAIDKEAAYRHYESAAEGGLAEAWHNLGLCEIFGEGTIRDAKRGAANFLRAAESGLVESTFNAGLCLEFGFGVFRNPDAAFAAYRAIANDYSPAERRIAPPPSGSFRLDGNAFFFLTLAVGLGICALARDGNGNGVGAVVFGVAALVALGLAFWRMAINDRGERGPKIDAKNMTRFLAQKILVPYTVDFFEENSPQDFNAENVRVVNWRELKEIDAEKLAELAASGGPFALYLDGSGADDSTLERLRGSDLRALSLQSCPKITAVGLAYLNECPNLRDLVLGASGFFKAVDGVAVPTFRVCRRIGDAEIRSVAQIKSLRNLEIYGGVNITDAGIETLAALSSLTDLTLIGCDGISEDGWRFLENLPRLKTLDVGSKRFRGRRLSFLRNAKRLTTLILRRTGRIGDAAFRELGALPLLRRVDLRFAPFVWRKQAKILRELPTRPDVATSALTGRGSEPGAYGRLFLYGVAFWAACALIAICARF